MNKKPNVIFLLTDQLRAMSLPRYGNPPIETPNIDRLASEGMRFTNSISTCPVCTPYRSMMLTGRHPQSTGHIMNFVNTRHDEISIADTLKDEGYQTAWVGKWHLHRGSFPNIGGRDFVPEGRDRLGFDYWRGYNFHMDYFNGSVNLDDWDCENWDGYETDALNQYAVKFIEQADSDKPFCLFVSPHQPHFTPGDFAPEKYYEKLPKTLSLPANVSKDGKHYEQHLSDYRHYLAMILAVDDMLGELLDYLDEKGLSDDTIFIFSADHGTQMGAHEHWAFAKKLPYEESIHTPLIVRYPNVLPAGSVCDELVAPVDIFPTLCSLLDVDAPATIEGHDLTPALLNQQIVQDAVLTMNFTASHDYIANGAEWRGVRTKTHTYTTWLNGRIELFDIVNDPQQLNNLAGKDTVRELEHNLNETLQKLMTNIGDELVPCETYRDWFDEQRRVVKNVHGTLPHPETDV